MVINNINDLVAFYRKYIDFFASPFLNKEKFSEILAEDKELKLLNESFIHAFQLDTQLNTDRPSRIYKLNYPGELNKKAKKWLSGYKLAITQLAKNDDHTLLSQLLTQNFQTKSYILAFILNHIKALEASAIKWLSNVSAIKNADYLQETLHKLKNSPHYALLEDNIRQINTAINTSHYKRCIDNTIKNTRLSLRLNALINERLFSYKMSTKERQGHFHDLSMELNDEVKKMEIPIHSSDYEPKIRELVEKTFENHLGNTAKKNYVPTLSNQPFALHRPSNNNSEDLFYRNNLDKVLFDLNETQETKLHLKKCIIQCINKDKTINFLLKTLIGNVNRVNEFGNDKEKFYVDEFKAFINTTLMACTRENYQEGVLAGYKTFKENWQVGEDEQTEQEKRAYACIKASIDNLKKETYRLRIEVK